MLKPIHLSASTRMFRRARIVKKKGLNRYPGSPEQILRLIVTDCWNGKYFMTSAGHFCEFWMRDFAWCIEPLIRMGYKKECDQTIRYALNIYSKKKAITTTISPRGIPSDFPYYSPDSLAYMIRCLRILNDKSLVTHYKDFLNKEIKKFSDIVMDKDKGIVKEGLKLSSIKDYALRSSSCYNNTMAAMLAKEIEYYPELENPLSSYDIKKNIKKHFWKEDHFVDDLSGLGLISGDANIFPFWTGVFKEKAMIKQSLSRIQKEGLDKPFPLKYNNKRSKDDKMFWMEIFVKGYERDSIWAHTGMIYLQLLKDADNKKAVLQIEEYKKKVAEHGTFLEVYTSDGRPFETFFYYSDEAMLWSAMLLDMIRETK